MDENIDEIIRKAVLTNAVSHGGVAQAKSVLGKILADYPDFRKDLFNLKTKIDKSTEEVNLLSAEKQKQDLDALGGLNIEKKIEKKELPDIDIGRSFVLRFAPNPDGAIHLGNARPAIISDEYKRKYKGKLILRFDDTDPKKKKPGKEFYKWIKDDLKWLKIKFEQEIIASKRLKIYYSYTEKLIKSGDAYICVCNTDSWKDLRDKNKACPCRKLDTKEQMKRWRKMLASNVKKTGYKEGEAVLRIKTDLEAKNPAVRDWPAMRIVDAPEHPFSKNNVWPLYNLASAIDDHLLGVTHIFRGQEHATNEVKQRYLYQYFGWKYPATIILGRFSMSEMILSKSEIRDGIKNGVFSSWEDLRLATIRALKRRGFQPEAIRNIIKDVGVKPSDITISFENLAAYNRKIIDKTAKRFFFIPNPKRIDVKGLKMTSVKIPVHPDQPDKKRTLKIDKAFYIDKDDFGKYKGIEVRLKDLCNIKLDELSVVTGNEVKPIPKIQWVPKDHMPVRVFMPTKEIKGYGEKNLTKTKIGDIVQFERFGFVRIEKVSPSNIICVFCHE